MRKKICSIRDQLLESKLGTCESFFFVRIESRIESAVQFVFESNRLYTTQAITQPNGLLYSLLIRRYFVFVMNKSDVRTTELRTEYLFISIQS